MSEWTGDTGKTEKYIKKIEKSFRKNAYIKFVAIPILLLSLLFFIEKNVFSILSLPWAISYLVTSSWNGQFDQNVFREVFSINDGIDKIRLLNLMVLWVFYGFFLTFIHFVFHIFATENVLHKKKKMLILFLANILFILSLFGMHARDMESIAVFLISWMFFWLINFYFIKDSLHLSGVFFYDDKNKEIKSKAIKSHILCTVVWIGLMSITMYLLVKNNALSMYYGHITRAYDLLVEFKHSILFWGISIYLIISFLSIRKMYRENGKKMLSRDFSYQLLILSLISFTAIVLLQDSDLGRITLLLYLIPFLLLIVYKLVTYHTSKDVQKSFSNMVRLKNKKVGETIGLFGGLILSSLLRNKILFILYLIWVIIFISTKDINNQSVFQWVLPVEGYISINKYDENLEKIHNKLQLPSYGYSKNTTTLIDKIKIINWDTQEGRILWDFCILWESDKYYYISTYFDPNHEKKSFDCKTLNNIQLLKIEKNSDLEIRYLKNIHFDNLGYSIYKSLITEHYSIKDMEREIYEIISRKYEGKMWYTSYKTADRFYDMVYEKYTAHYLDVIFDYVIEKIIHKGEIDYDYVLSEIMTRASIVNRFVNGTKDDAIYHKYFIGTVKLDRKINDFVHSINRKEEEELYTAIKSIFENNKIITGEKMKDRIEYVDDNIIFESIRDSVKYIDILWNMSHGADISDKLVYNEGDKQEGNTIQHECVEIWAKNNIAYHISNLDIKYLLTKTGNGNYRYTYTIYPTKKLELDYGVCP